MTNLLKRLFMTLMRRWVYRNADSVVIVAMGRQYRRPLEPPWCHSNVLHSPGGPNNDDYAMTVAINNLRLVLDARNRDQLD